MFRGWIWNKHWAEHLFPYAQRDSYATDLYWGRWQIGFSPLWFPQSDHGGHMCVSCARSESYLYWTNRSPRYFHFMLLSWMAIKVLLVLLQWKDIQYFLLVNHQTIHKATCTHSLRSEHVYGFTLLLLTSVQFCFEDSLGSGEDC